MDTVKKSKPLSILVITVIYIAASVLGVITFLKLPFAFWLNLLIADAAATVFVFIFSLVFKNASVYDPYWSVQPVVIALCFAFGHKITPATVLLLISIIYWGVRLTGNWAYVFGGLNHQDWRYAKLEKENGRLYQLINFTGIHMMPTLIVYLCTLPAVFVIRGNIMPMPEVLPERQYAYVPPLCSWSPMSRCISSERADRKVLSAPVFGSTPDTRIISVRS